MLVYIISLILPLTPLKHVLQSGEKALGFFVAPNGYFVMPYKYLRGYTEIKIAIYDKRYVKAYLIYKDEKLGYALFKTRIDFDFEHVKVATAYFVSRGETLEIANKRYIVKDILPNFILLNKLDRTLIGYPVFNVDNKVVGMVTIQGNMIGVLPIDEIMAHIDTVSRSSKSEVEVETTRGGIRIVKSLSYLRSSLSIKNIRLVKNYNYLSNIKDTVPAPTRMCFYSNRMAFIASSLNNKIYKYDIGSSRILGYTDYSIGKIVDMCLHNDLLYVLDGVYKKLLVFNMNLKLIKEWYFYQIFPSTVFEPISIAVNDRMLVGVSRYGEIFVRTKSSLAGIPHYTTSWRNYSRDNGMINVSFKENNISSAKLFKPIADVGRIAKAFLNANGYLALIDEELSRLYILNLNTGLYKVAYLGIPVDAAGYFTNDRIYVIGGGSVYFFSLDAKLIDKLKIDINGIKDGGVAGNRLVLMFNKPFGFMIGGKVVRSRSQVPVAFDVGFGKLIVLHRTGQLSVYDLSTKSLIKKISLRRKYDILRVIGKYSVLLIKTSTPPNIALLNLNSRRIKSLKLGGIDLSRVLKLVRIGVGDKYILIPDYHSHKILVLDKRNVVVETFITLKDKYGRFVNPVMALEVENDKVLVLGTNRIFLYDLNGNLLPLVRYFDIARGRIVEDYEINLPEGVIPLSFVYYKGVVMVLVKDVVDGWYKVLGYDLANNFKVLLRSMDLMGVRMAGDKLYFLDGETGAIRVYRVVY